MQLTCSNCEEFKPNMEELERIAVLAAMHEMAYQGKPFKFCPWCGHRLSSK